MIIPKSFLFTLHPQAQRWTVTHGPNLRTTHAGDCYPYVQQIHVYSAIRYGARTQAQQWHTFWHEFLHAALYDMKHPLYRDEQFVDQLAQRLATATDTAELP